MTNVFGFSDAARRATDIINTHIAALGASCYGRWVALRLSDGSSDGVVYDTKQAAIDHQLHETQCMYISIPLGGAREHEIQRFLDMNRQLYDRGYRLVDPATMSNHPLIRKLS